VTEVSGGITRANVGDYAAAGPDRISVGALTHSAPVLDLGLDLLSTEEAPTRDGAYGAHGVPAAHERND
jgi:nicotinate-nucleotide pyrophosphorylase (carboxylating)